MIQAIFALWLAVWSVIPDFNRHEHFWHYRGSFQDTFDSACACGATRRSWWVDVTPAPRPDNLVGLGTKKAVNGPIIEPKPKPGWAFATDADTGFWMDTDGWHFVFRGRRVW